MVDRGNRERGLRAAIHNPRVSEEAKQRDREILETEFGEHFEESPLDVENISQGAMSSEPEYESPPPRVKQTAALHSSNMQSSTATTSSSKSKSSPPVTEDTTRFSSAVPTSWTKTGKTRSSSAGVSAAGSSSAHEDLGGKDAGSVIRGLKAAISNPNVSDKAKEKDRKKLRELGESVE